MSDGVEFRLRIEAFTPETMPMQRLADYLAEFSRMLGECASVHFVRLEPGSTSIIHRIGVDAIPKVKRRAAAARQGQGPRDSVRAYRRLNKMLSEDDGRAMWSEYRNQMDIIVFPGKEEAGPTFGAISQPGSLDGEIVRIGGLQDVVSLLLKRENQELSGCSAIRSIAKELAHHLFERVRLFGVGRWTRNEEGIWKLETFAVESFRALRDVSLSEALSELRSIPAEWDDDAFDELTFVRNGDEESVSGGV